MSPLKSTTFHTRHPRELSPKYLNHSEESELYREECLLPSFKSRNISPSSSVFVLLFFLFSHSFQPQIHSGIRSKRLLAVNLNPQKALRKAKSNDKHNSSRKFRKAHAGKWKMAAAFLGKVKICLSGMPSSNINAL